MSGKDTKKPVCILLVEDNPGDIRLILEALKSRKRNLNISTVTNGEEALWFLAKKDKYTDAPRPDIILLDLNLPKINGFEVLQEIKSDPEFKSIPVIILSTSISETDINRAYLNHANCYLSKPSNFESFYDLFGLIEDFWLDAAHLPGGD